MLHLCVLGFICICICICIWWRYGVVTRALQHRCRNATETFHVTFHLRFLKIKFFSLITVTYIRSTNPPHQSSSMRLRLDRNNRVSRYGYLDWLFVASDSYWCDLGDPPETTPCFIALHGCFMERFRNVSSSSMGCFVDVIACCVGRFVRSCKSIYWLGFTAIAARATHAHNFPMSAVFMPVVLT